MYRVRVRPRDNVMKTEVRRPLEWGILANEFAFLSSLIMLIGSFLGLIQPFQHWEIAVYSLILGICILFVEYPRSYRKTATFERKYQNYLVPILSSSGLFGRSYYIRFLLYFCMGVPCCILLPTLVAGLCMIISSLMYLKAAVNGEEWQSKCSVQDEIKQSSEPQLLLPWESLKRTSFLESMKETVC